MKIIFVLAMVLLCVAVVFAKVKDDVPFKCIEKGDYMENNCNRCTCLNGGLACTKKLCVYNPPPPSCKPNTHWKNKDGKECWCDKIWGSVCRTD